jgi:hypothetical protein
VSDDNVLEKEKVQRQEGQIIMFRVGICVMVLIYLYQFGWPAVGLGLIGSLVFICMVVSLADSMHNGLERNKVEALRPQRDKQIVCPHCQTKGHVTTAAVKVNKGISGEKATGAILTGGISMLATGLSDRQMMTKATCSNCGSVWHF